MKRIGIAELRILLCLPVLMALLWLPGLDKAGAEEKAHPMAQGTPIHHGDPFEGTWVTEMDSLRNYYNSILEPVKCTCESIEGPFSFRFEPRNNPSPMLSGFGKATIETYTTRICLRRQRSGGRFDDISFSFRGGVQADYEVYRSAAGDPVFSLSNEVDQGIALVRDICVNGTMIGEMDVSTMELSLRFGTGSWKYEFLDNRRMKVTGIILPREGEPTINPSHILLVRQMP